MAIVFPTIENIKRLKVQPTEGEWFLLNYLIDKLDDTIEIFFQPFLNGDRPDIVLMKKGAGVIIIEVKDWKLDSYRVDKENQWFVKKGDRLIRSPMRQVLSYKSNLFRQHISGLFEHRLAKPTIDKLIAPFVYFHYASKSDIANFYQSAINQIETEIEKNNKRFRNQEINFDIYTKVSKRLNKEKEVIDWDKYKRCVTKDDLHKITDLGFLKSVNTTFDSSIYNNFKRILQPPYHTKEEGIEIVYEKKQLEYTKSMPGFAKIKGVAGSGKTVVLAKRAVNAHKRHGDIVLILTFNITLRSYIRDRISDVREDFDWGYFYINYYHQHILQTMNQHNMEIGDRNIKEVYKDINLFEGKKVEKYKTILIDEAQDYDPEWIKIIRKYFLEESGEMVLFGDEKQNIYESELDENRNIRTPNGFGAWLKLNKSIRHKKDSHILKLAKEYQNKFLSTKYEIDSYEENSIQQQIAGFGLNKVAIYSDNNIDGMVQTIYKNIEEQNIHPDDVAIISSQIKKIQDVDDIIRSRTGEKTITTFEPKDYSGSDIDGYRRAKKIAFNHHPGLVKLSTIHSFKGFETSTIFLILEDNDRDEMVYTGITRAKFNIMVFIHENSRFKDFFKSHLAFEGSPKISINELIKNN